ncbi:hypothetical protein THRCLA_20911, partial [Thraustotheca clavata]
LCSTLRESSHACAVVLSERLQIYFRHNIRIKSELTLSRYKAKPTTSPKVAKSWGTESARSSQEDNTEARKQAAVAPMNLQQLYMRTYQTSSVSVARYVRFISTTHFSMTLLFMTQ